jgi:uncharacterized RDD family membrane protein YckC
LNENYLKEFERWTAGPAPRREALKAELAEHLREAEAAGELGSALTRLGPPRDAAKAFAAGRELKPAPLGRRICAFLIDVAIPLLFAGVVVAIGTAVGSGETAPGFFDENATDARSVVWTALEVGAAMLLGLAGLWWFFGLTVVEWRYGRTPGKAVMGLRVVSEDGISLSFGQAVVRRLTLVFSGPLQIIDWVFALFDARRQRGVEKMAHTLVVRDEMEPRLPAATGAPAIDGAH